MFSADQLRRLAGVRNMPHHAVVLAAAAAKHMPEFEIVGETDMALFWASIAVETGGFQALEENLHYTARRLMEVWPSRFNNLKIAKAFARDPRRLANEVYGDRLGNEGKKDAGWLYRGSGPMMTTGYDNFALVEKISGLPVISKPDLLREDADAGMLAACIFWRHRVGTGRVIHTEDDLKAVRKRVNGGLHGWTLFKKYYLQAKEILTSERLIGNPVADVEPSKETEKNPTSKILPLYRPKQSDAVTLAVMEKFKSLVPVDCRGDKVKVLVVRGYYLNSMGKKGVNDRAMYDDAIFVVSPDGIQPFNGNSDPSVFRKRVATIKANQAIRYRSGMHGYSRKGGPYPAFRQDRICTVYRDGVGDDTGMFHVNLHRGGVNGTSSLGCLTVPPHQWDEFHDLVSRLLKKYGQESFFVTLLKYPGDKPPVSIPPKNSPVRPVSAPATQGAIAVALAAVGGLVASWWGNISTWLGGLF